MSKMVIVQKQIKKRKCNKCDDYGRVETLNNPDNPNSGVYLPFCDCPYGQWMKEHQTDGDMFSRGRGNRY